MSLKNVYHFALVLILSTVSSISAQYSNSSVTGAWIIKTSEAPFYVYFDGGGVISSVGVFDGLDGSLGYYSVSPQGVVTGTLNSLGGLPFTAQLTSENEGYASLGVESNIEFLRIDESLLNTTWVSTFTDATNGTLRNVELTLNASGVIEAAVGVDGVRGRVYLSGSVFTGYIETLDAQCNWQKFRIYGDFSNEILSGTMVQSCQSQGSVSMIRKSEPNSISSRYSRRGLQFKLYPNPVVDMTTFIVNEDLGEVELNLVDLTGRSVSNEKMVIEANKENEIIVPDHLPSGIYYLQLVGTDYQFAQKIYKM